MLKALVEYFHTAKHILNWCQQIFKPECEYNKLAECEYNKLAECEYNKLAEYLKMTQ